MGQGLINGPGFFGWVFSSLVESNNVANVFSGSYLDPYAIETTEEHEAEAIHGVMTRVLFTRLMVTVGGLMILVGIVVGIGTMGGLELIEENVT